MLEHQTPKQFLASITCGVLGPDDHFRTPLAAATCDCGEKTSKELYEAAFGPEPQLVEENSPNV